MWGTVVDFVAVDVNAGGLKEGPLPSLVKGN